MKSLLLTFLPDNALALVMMVIAIGLMIGIISRRLAFGYVGMIILYATFAPFIDSIFELLPPWLLLIIMFAFIFGIGRALLNLLFGMRATDHFVGLLMWNLFALPFRFLRYLLGTRRAR